MEKIVAREGIHKKNFGFVCCRKQTMAKKGGNSSEKYGQHTDEKEGTDKIYDDSSNTKKLLIFL